MNAKSDGRHRRKRRTENAIRGALDRLLRGRGTHPKHSGLKLRITKAAVAREARINIATLYRFPDLCAEIDVAIPIAAPSRNPQAEKIRNRLLNEVTSLKDQLRKVLQENLRLARALEKYDPSLGVSVAINLDERRKRQA